MDGTDPGRSDRGDTTSDLHGGHTRVGIAVRVDPEVHPAEVGSWSIVMLAAAGIWKKGDSRKKPVTIKKIKARVASLYFFRSKSKVSIYALTADIDNV